VLAIRLLVDIEASEPGLPVRVVVLFPLRVPEGVLVELAKQVGSDLLRHQVDGKGWEPAARIVVGVVLHDAATLLTLLKVVAAEEGPATDVLGLNRAARMKNRLVEDDPGLALREDLPRTVVAIIAVGDREGHLAGVIADFVERIDLLDDGALDHVVVPSAAEVVVVQNIIHNLRFQVLVDGFDLDSSDGGVRSRLGKNLQVFLRILRDNSEAFVAIHNLKELFKFLISSDVLLTLL